MSKPETGDYIAWIDLETTGTNELLDQIIEVGLVVTDRDLNPVEKRNWVVYLPDPGSLLTMDSVVIDMHTKSGLLADVLKALKSETAAPDIASVDQQVADVLKGLNGSRHTVLGGSGVMHFDRRFIKAYMPKTDKALTYWAYDVGVLRRFMRMAGFPIPTEGNLTHRAVEDVEAHIAEAQQYLNLLRNHQDLALPAFTTEAV